MKEPKPEQANGFERTNLTLYRVRQERQTNKNRRQYGRQVVRGPRNQRHDDVNGNDDNGGWMFIEALFTRSSRAPGFLY